LSGSVHYAIGSHIGKIGPCLNPHRGELAKDQQKPAEKARIGQKELFE
jgi:hypothetical protein